jgi:predicted RNA binding protein YcfA (HicA-like mRNA interferase family)
MKLPRDVGGEELATLLRKYGYRITRQTGSHIRVTSNAKSTEHHISIPRHKPLKVGTLSSILSDLASYLEVEKQKLIEDLFE